MDDADDVLLPFGDLPQRLSPVLGRVQYNKHCDAVFCHRVGGVEAGCGYWPRGHEGQEI